MMKKHTYIIEQGWVMEKKALKGNRILFALALIV